MSKPQRQRRRNRGHNNWHGGSRPVESRDVRFSVFRALEPTEATDIRLQLSEQLGQLPGIRFRGYGDQQPPAAHLLMTHETRDRPGVRDIGREALNELLSERVPALGKKDEFEVLNIGRFGTNGSATIPIAACLGECQGTLSAERGELEALLSELDGWEPVSLRSTLFHVSLLSLPGNTPSEQIARAKEVTRSVVPASITLLEPKFVTV